MQQQHKQLHPGTLVSVGKGLLRFSDIVDSQEEVVAAQWALDGAPVASLYSEQLCKLIILSTESPVICDDHSKGVAEHPCKRLSQPVITMLDLAEGIASPNDVSNGSTVRPVPHYQMLSSKPGERFLGMLEWFPEVDGKAYHLLVFNTIINFRRKSPAGRLLLCAFTKMESDAASLVVKTTINSNTPVFSAASFGEQCSLIYSSGSELVIVGLESSATGVRLT